MSLAEYQDQIRKLVVELGFEKETVPVLFMLLLEEAGEFAKAARKSAGVKNDKQSAIHNVEEEAADVFWLLLDLCNRLDIDLEKAFTEKVKVNRSRKWS